MKRLVCIGEALIDFIPSKTNCDLKDVPVFERVCGGAPANAAAAFARLGGSSRLITQLGYDAFGDHIEEMLRSVGVDTGCILRTKAANTALAFVSLKSDGNRDFSFYRKPSADMLLDADAIKAEWFRNCGALHFCSVDLIDAPIKAAHVRAIEYARENGALISFDPNIRLPLWENADECRNTVRDFLPYADIVKISDEELEFITGTADIEKAAWELFGGGAKIILYSMGSEGAMVLTPEYSVQVPNHPVKAVDTTGAGDGIIGAFLYMLLSTDTDIEDKEKMHQCLEFANLYANYSVCKNGAIASYANMDEITKFISECKGTVCDQ